MSRRLILLMALACGVGVANVYFVQALIPLISRGLHVSLGAAAFVATASQVGYAAGIFLLVPLGDRFPRRPLIAVLFGVVAVGLVLAGVERSLPPLLLLGVLVGAATVVPQILIPMAADLDGGKAGTVGVLQGGLLGGVLLARTFGGVLGQWVGWRAPYLVAGALAVLLAVVLATVLPSTASGTRHSYPALLGTTLDLVRRQPALRRSGLYQALLFGGFSAAWTSIALLLTGPTYRFGTGVVGLVALVGAASVLIVPMTGRLIDRRGPDIVNTLCFVGMGLAALVLLAGLIRGPVGLAGLVVGMVLMDVSVQSSQVANQARIFALVPTARSRLNSAYMTAVFLGGSAGSWVGVRVYLSFGWAGVCALVALAGLAALVTHVSGRRELSVVDSSLTECRPEQAGMVIRGDHDEDCVAVDPA